MGWDGIRFTVPVDWTITAVSAGRGDGYLKVDSPGSMFMQVKWSDPSQDRSRTLMGIAIRSVQRFRRAPSAETEVPPLRQILETFLKDTEKRARKTKLAFQCKVKPETKEADGERTVLHFSWSGSGKGQGKIWFCRRCRRTVIAQVVGQSGDPVSDAAAAVFSDMRDHSDDGWITWGVFDLVAGVPGTLKLNSHQFMSGYLKLEFVRAGEGRVVLERWGLANVARKRFTIREWLETTVGAAEYRPDYTAGIFNDHEGCLARGRLRGLQRVYAWRDALPTLRPAVSYEACAWECPQSNKLYALQTWRPQRAVSIMGDLVARCECH